MHNRINKRARIAAQSRAFHTQSCENEQMMGNNECAFLQKWKANKEIRVVMQSGLHSEYKLQSSSQQ